MVDLKNFVCSAPFHHLEIRDNRNLICCDSWLNKILPGNIPLNEVWNSEEAKEIRKSVMDGSYKFCDNTQCVYLSELLKTGKETVMIKHVDNLPDQIRTYYEKKIYSIDHKPTYLKFSFDRTCNFKCPSCRLDLVVPNSQKVNKIKKTMNEIEETYGDSVKIIHCSTSADPFASVTFRNWLRNFDPKKYPKLQKIHLQTNASLWDEEMWNSMSNIHPYVKSCHISIDAATKETYENVTRLGGDWNQLIKNLEFIYTIPHIKFIRTSFVVQKDNYKEMNLFLDLMKNVLKEKVYIFFSKVNNFVYTEEEYKKVKIWDKSHPEFDDFVKELLKVVGDPRVTHNLHECIIYEKKLI